MIAKILLYAAIFIIVRAWLKILFKPKTQVKSKNTADTKSFNSKDVFEADYKVVKDD